MAKFKIDRAAAALAEAQLKSDAQVAEVFGVSVRSLESWRARLTWDPQLREAYEKMVEAKLKPWQSKIPEALDSAIDFVMRAAEVGDPSNPEMLAAVVNAMMSLNEVLVIQASLAQRKIRMPGNPEFN